MSGRDPDVVFQADRWEDLSAHAWRTVLSEVADADDRYEALGILLMQAYSIGWNHRQDEVLNVIGRESQP